MPRSGRVQRVVSSSKKCSSLDVVEMKHLHQFKSSPCCFNVMWQPPLHLSLVEQFHREERGPMCICVGEDSKAASSLVRALRFSRTISVERHNSVCKTWAAFVSVAHVTANGERRKSLQSTKMYRGKIIWKRPYETPLHTRRDEEVQQAYLKRKRSTKRSGRILFVRAATTTSNSTTESSTSKTMRKSSSTSDAVEKAIKKSKERTLSLESPYTIFSSVLFTLQQLKKKLYFRYD